jgi:hypothetical protein
MSIFSIIKRLKRRSHVETPPPRWKVHYKNRFLLAVMEELAGNAKICFEGDLQTLPILRFPGASTEETGAFKRNTTWPKQDFVIVPLEPSTVRPILAAIGGTIPRDIWHILIAKAGKLEFAAYDNFHPECLYFGKALKQRFLESLVSDGLLERLKD